MGWPGRAVACSPAAAAPAVPAQAREVYGLRPSICGEGREVGEGGGQHAAACMEPQHSLQTVQAAAHNSSPPFRSCGWGCACRKGPSAAGGEGRGLRWGGSEGPGAEGRALGAATQPEGVWDACRNSWQQKRHQAGAARLTLSGAAGAVGVVGAGAAGAAAASAAMISAAPASPAGTAAGFSAAVSGASTAARSAPSTGGAPTLAGSSPSARGLKGSPPAAPSPGPAPGATAMRLASTSSSTGTAGGASAAAVGSTPSTCAWEERGREEKEGGIDAGPRRGAAGQSRLPTRSWRQVHAESLEES